MDWEDSLPAEEMQKSELNCKNSDLIICLGTSLQIMPVGNYPLLTKKNNGKIVIINLQKTRMDKNASLVIHAKLDLVFEMLMQNLKIKMSHEKIIEINLKLDQDPVQGSDKLLNMFNVEVDSSYKSKLEPNLVLILSGKRKSGKDFVSQKIVEYLKEKSESICVTLVTISAPLKQAYAEENNLDFEKLLDSSEYKEIYRKQMIEWSDTKRAQDPGYFCRKAVENEIKNLETNSNLNKKFLIFLITDARRKTDLQYFNSTYPSLIKTVRVYASEEVRKQRNWVFTPGDQIFNLKDQFKIFFLKKRFNLGS